MRRTSVPGQGDDLADVNVDTWQVDAAAGVADWQVRVTLLRGGAKGPTVDSVGAVASRLPDVERRRDLGARARAPAPPSRSPATRR